MEIDKLNEVKRLIGNHQMKDAFGLLEELFPGNNEILHLKSNYNYTIKEYDKNKKSSDANSEAVSRITEALLNTLDELSDNQLQIFLKLEKKSEDSTAGHFLPDQPRPRMKKITTTVNDPLYDQLFEHRNVLADFYYARKWVWGISSHEQEATSLLIKISDTINFLRTMKGNSQLKGILHHCDLCEQYLSESQILLRKFILHKEDTRSLLNMRLYDLRKNINPLIIKLEKYLKISGLAQ